MSSRGDIQVYAAFAHELNRLKDRATLDDQELAWVRDLAFRTRTRDNNIRKMIDDTLTVVVPLAIKERLTS